MVEDGTAPSSEPGRVWTGGPRLQRGSAVPVRNALLGSGRFLTILPGSALQFPSKNPVLQSLPIKLPIAPRPIAAITLKNRTPSPLVKLFIDCACEVAKPTARATS